MILHKAAQEEAILSNVGQVGEFRISNSAKAFNILSSQLYANKIRAFIRELSCNAVDSHIDAGNGNTPFDVHLPNTLEPWFSVRDYGTGMDHAQITDVYTTYFESTKTGSNDFIGALGLGSKSPFSYTDNFTVTTIKNGRKGIYTAFINDKGVPSVALMTEELKCEEPAGVEVKFSANDKGDFYKFGQEAAQVFTYFKLRPVISGVSNFNFINQEYSDKNIIPGVHVAKRGEGESVAIMGNIAYPIDIPASDKTLGDLKSLLECSLVMEFPIGSLDFQPSREGLSYIPATINAIKAKLQALNAQLAIHLATEADKIKNLWERGVFLKDRADKELWKNAVIKYATDTKFPLYDSTPLPAKNSYYYRRDFLKDFEFSSDKLAKKFNIKLRGFSHSRHADKMRTLNEHSIHNAKTGNYEKVWQITVDLSHRFVFNDGRVGALQRAKAHWRAEATAPTGYTAGTVFVLDKHDKTLPIKEKEFLAAIKSPPAKQSMKASTLRLQPRKAGGMTGARILQLEDRTHGRYNNRTSQSWVSAGTFDKVNDSKKTFYYLPMKGFRSLGQVTDMKHLRPILKESKIHESEIYGVRKADLAKVSKEKNWVNLDKAVEDMLTKMPQSLIMSLVKYSIDKIAVLKYDIVSLIDANSPYTKLYTIFKNVAKAEQRQLHQLEKLCDLYKVKMTDDLKKMTAQYNKEATSVAKRYPLLENISGYGVKMEDVAEYVNSIDLMRDSKKAVPVV